MTRANTEQFKHTPWFAKAGAACSIVPISRFVGPNIFALKGGGYGCLFSLTGLDEEGLTDQELEARVRQIEGALRGLPEGSCLYQYTRVMSGFDLPRQKQYANEVTETFASDRLAQASTTPEQHHLQPNAPRSVTVSEAQTPPVIRAGLLQSTLILLPAEEKIATVFGGDTVDWVFDAGHVASRFISIKPKLANTTTDIHIVSDHRSGPGACLIRVS